MSIYTTEIASDRLVSDNPIHQRLLKAYYLSLPYLSGDLLEIGCGEGRGFDIVRPYVDSYTAVDKNQAIIDKLSERYSTINFKRMDVPPLDSIEDNSFDTVISFQVIEHIEDDSLFMKDIYRVLRPGGKVIITTPNSDMSLTRNPWHIREYTKLELRKIVKAFFPKVQLHCIAGNEKIMIYYEKNKRSVNRITRFDIFNLQYKLSPQLLRIPYDLMNRVNRLILNTFNKKLVSNMKQEDFFLQDSDQNGFDFFCVATKSTHKKYQK